LVDTVVDKIRSFIEDEHLAAGDRLPAEPQLVAKLGVSRTVLREALTRLETIGMLTVQRGRGMFVGDRKSLLNCAQLVRSAMAISSKEWVQFADFRAAIECHSVRRAAERATPEDIAELSAYIDKMNSETYAGAIREDFNFHLKIVTIAKNDLMHSVMEVLQEFIMAGMVQTTAEPRGKEGDDGLHREIVRAISSGDPDRAEKAMRAHADAVTLAFNRNTAAREKARQPEVIRAAV